MSKKAPRFRVIQEEVPDSGPHALEIEFPKKAGGVGRLHIARGLLLETHKARVHFANHGAIVPDDCASMFKELLEHDAPTIRLVGKTGWCDRQFVSRLGRVGKNGPDRAMLAATAHFNRKRQTRGTAEEFLEQIKPFLAASPFLLLAMIAALAAPLAARVRATNGFALCWSGQSSTGKTTCLRLAQSLLTRANEADLESFGNTTGILLDTLPRFGGQAIGFGDLKADLGTKAAVEKLRTVVFAATGGAVRQRKGEEYRESPDFTILMLSAEQPLHQLFVSNGISFEDGEAVRLIDMPVPDRSEGGIFAGADGAPADLIRSLETLLAHQHGTVLDQWIDVLATAKLRALRSVVTAQQNQFVENLGVLPALHARIAGHFGLLAATARLAITAEVLPSTKEHVANTLTQLFWMSITRIASRDTRTVEAWRIFFNIVRHLPTLEAGQKASMPAPAGFRRGVGTTSERVYLRRDILIERIGEDVFSTIILPSLVRAECLPAEGEKTIPVKQAGLDRARYFRISAASLVTLHELLGPELSA